MPIVEAHILAGYGAEEKSRLAKALTDAVRLVVPAPDEAITVLLSEHAPDAYMRGGIARTPAPALPDPIRIVTDYLAAMEARNLAAAQAMLGADFQMTFPGTAPMTQISELIAWAKDRYQFVEKTTHGIEALHAEGVSVVYTRGTLAGRWPDGTPFAGIRFIDRFELTGGKITRQEVWNDIAEVRPR
jgi:phenylpyruvate tautomerase PptA (4-oxalocrotonate tautomerase family)/ketosteroid isomerase-like protein